MALFRKFFFSLTALTLCAGSVWYTVKRHPSHLDTLDTIQGEQGSLVQSPLAQSKNPFALAESSEADISTIGLSAVNNREIEASPDNTNTIRSSVDTESPGCGVHCMRAIEVLKLPYSIADHEFEELHSLASRLAAYLQTDSHLIDEFVEIALQADGNKRKIIIAAFSLLPESDRLELGQALVQSLSERHRLDGIHVLASTESMSQHSVNELSGLLISEQSGYVRQSVVQALNRPEIFKGDAEVLTILSQVMQTESDALVRGEALFASARLTHDPQSLLTDSFSAIRSELPEYQQYGVRAMEEIFIRHTRNGGEISEYDRTELEQLVSDLMEPAFDNIPANVRSNIEDLFERFY